MTKSITLLIKFYVNCRHPSTRRRLPGGGKSMPTTENITSTTPDTSHNTTTDIIENEIDDELIIIMISLSITAIGIIVTIVVIVKCCCTCCQKRETPMPYEMCLTSIPDINHNTSIRRSTSSRRNVQIDNLSFESVELFSRSKND